jgi:hypothetical protein
VAHHWLTISISAVVAGREVREERLHPDVADINPLTRLALRVGRRAASTHRRQGDERTAKATSGRDEAFVAGRVHDLRRGAPPSNQHQEGVFHARDINAGCPVHGSKG